MTTINIYLSFKGNCEEAFGFYKKVFKKDFDHISYFRDMPAHPDFNIPESDKDKVMHVSMSISKETSLMGSDTGGEWSDKYKMGNNFSISISTDSKEEANRLFKELSHEGKVMMPMDETFWGSYFGSFSDKFGINWMVSYADPTRNK